MDIKAKRERHDAILARCDGSMNKHANDSTLRWLRAFRKDDFLNQHPADIRRAAKAFARNAKDLLRDGDPKDESVNNAVDGFVLLAEDCNDALEEKDEFAMYLGTSGATNSLVYDREGSPVRVLAPQDKLCAPSQAETRFNVGDVMGAMAGVRANPDVRNALSEGTDSAGGFTVPDVLLRPFIDQMRAKNTVIRAGARTIVTTSDSVRMAKLVADPVAQWRLENGTVAVSDATFGAVDLKAKSLSVIVKLSRELLMDSINAAEILQVALTKSFAQELDRVALFGSGTDPEPRGIANTSGVLTTLRATNGSALTDVSDVVDAYAPLLYEDLDYSEIRMIMHPRTAVALQKLHLDPDNANNGNVGGPTFWQSQSLDATRPAFLTTKVPIDQTAGDADNASSIIAGDFSQMLIGMREAMRIQVLSEAFVGNGQIGWACHMRADIALAQVKAFHVYSGIVPASS